VRAAKFAHAPSAPWRPSTEDERREILRPAIGGAAPAGLDLAPRDDDAIACAAP